MSDPKPQLRELVIRVRALIPYARYELHRTGQGSRWSQSRVFAREVGFSPAI